MIDYFPIRRIELKKRNETNWTLIDSNEYGNARYSVSSFAYSNQDGGNVITAQKREILSFVMFDAARLGKYQTLNTLVKCDCRITFGEVSYTEQIALMNTANLELLDYTVDEEGDIQIAVTVRRTLDAHGEPIDSGVVRIGYGNGNPSGNQFDVDIVELKDSMRFIQNQYENELTLKRHRRMRGYKRRFRVSFAPFEARFGIGERLQRALMTETLFIRAWNVWGETNAVNTFREVVCINDELEKEDVLDNLASGRGATLEFEDAALNPKTFPILIDGSLTTLNQLDNDPLNPNTTAMLYVANQDDEPVEGAEVTLFRQRVGGVSEWEFWQKGFADTAGEFVSGTQAGAEYTRVKAVIRFGYSELVKEIQLVNLAL